jgi:hypothetical protein
LEHRQYLFAWKVHKHECGDANSLGELIDGDFEGKMDQHDGFGWIYDNSKSAANLALDRTDPQSGQQSLRLKFDGNFLTPFVTQTVIVESNTEYNFSFYYKSDGIIAGSLPIIQLVLEGPNEKQVLKEIEIKGEKADWRFFSTSFETNSGGEALEISVMQRPCDQSECPIFGNLWVDDFQIAKTNRIKH